MHAAGRILVESQNLGILVGQWAIIEQITRPPWRYFSRRTVTLDFHTRKLVSLSVCPFVTGTLKAMHHTSALVCESLWSGEAQTN